MMSWLDVLYKKQIGDSYDFRSSCEARGYWCGRAVRNEAGRFTVAVSMDRS